MKKQIFLISLLVLLIPIHQAKAGVHSAAAVAGGTIGGIAGGILIGYLIGKHVSKKNKEAKTIGNFYLPPTWDDEVRCDLHPRWNEAGDMIAVDTVVENRRQMLLISLQ